MDLIGISGKIGHGKDLAATMIQYIHYKNRYVDNDHRPLKSYDEFELEMSDSSRSVISYCQVEKFGGKLKDMICVLLGCTRKDLEDRDFKESSLGPEWLKYVLTYVDKYQDVPYTETFLSREEAEDYLEKQNCVYRSNIEEVQLTPRLLLQLLGTECGRNILHPNIWVNATLKDYSEQLRWIKDFPENESKFNSWVISDVRFSNEVIGIEKMGGIVIRVERDNVVSTSKHPSETSLDDHDFKYVVKNNGTKHDLLKKLTVIYNEHFNIK